MYHPDAWKYNYISDDDHPLIAQYIRTREDLMAKAEEKRIKYYGNRQPIFPPESIFGTMIMQENVPYNEFHNWMMTRRATA